MVCGWVGITGWLGSLPWNKQWHFYWLISGQQNGHFVLFYASLFASGETCKLHIIASSLEFSIVLLCHSNHDYVFRMMRIPTGRLNECGAVRSDDVMAKGTVGNIACHSLMVEQQQQEKYELHT